MQTIIPGVYTFTGLIVGRVYLIEDPDGLTIIDTGLGSAAASILKQLRQKGHAPQEVKRILITHAHPDHVGGLRRLQTATGATVFALAQEQPYIEGKEPIPRANQAEMRGIARLMASGKPTFVTEPVTVHRPLRDGEILSEVLGGLQVVWTPGHAPGHTAYWQAQKGIVFCGDVMMRMTGLTLPFAGFTPSMADNKRSLRRVVELEPRIVCFGHGQPMMTNTATTIRQFAQKVGALS